MSIVEHAERYLGEIDQGWKDNTPNNDLKIVSFKGCPLEPVTTFMSLGLSNHILDISEAKKVRLEIVFSAYSMTISSMVVSFLLSLCEAILSRGKAVLRGEIIPLSKELATRIGFDAVYCAIPVFFDEAFSTYDNSSPPTVVVWALPIYSSEIAYIKANGWESFESLLEEKNPDLCSLERAPVI